MTNLSKTRVLFVGVFDKNFQSTNTSQLIALNGLGVKVIGYNYRDKAAKLGPEARDTDLVDTVIEKNIDLVIFSKCNQVSFKAFREITTLTKTCLWFMDPLVSYNQEMQIKTSLVDFFCCDKKDVLETAKWINNKSYHVHEGFDSINDKPHNVDKQYDISFIGNMYGDRQDKLAKIDNNVNVISNAYGSRHAEEVGKSRINLNFCTSNGASDRVYKILAAKGFLLTDDWEGRQEVFKNNHDLVIFSDTKDLNEKIAFYLNNQQLAESIAAQGYETVQKYTRNNWAQRIIEIYEQHNE
jgi:spore maturation protein CgeB